VNVIEVREVKREIENVIEIETVTEIEIEKEIGRGEEIEIVNVNVIGKGREIETGIETEKEIEVILYQGEKERIMVTHLIKDHSKVMIKVKG